MSSLLTSGACFSWLSMKSRQYNHFTARVGYHEAACLGTGPAKRKWTHRGQKWPCYWVLSRIPDTSSLLTRPGFRFRLTLFAGKAGNFSQVD
jgi:hypothetical protein